MSIVALESSGPLPAARARISLVSASGKRMQPRVSVPLRMSFADGRCRHVKDWSLTGFSLPAASFAAAEGSVHQVHLRVPLAGCEVTVEADAKVTRVAGAYALGFRFIGMAPERSRVIEHFVRSGVSGDAAVVGGLPFTHDETSEIGPRRRGALLRNAGQALKLALLTALVVGGTGFVAARMLTVTTDYAAVSATLQQIHAPEAGYLVSERLAVGSHLFAGQRIGTIQPVADVRTRLATETQIVSLEAGLKQQRLALEQAKAGFAIFLQSSRTELEEAIASRQMLETQVSAENRVRERLTALKARDVVGQQRLDEEQQSLLVLQRALSAARGAEAAARQKLANAEAGRFGSDGRTTQRSPADLQYEIETMQTSIAGRKAVLAGLDRPVPIVSPCDCTVTAIGTTPGSFVLSGAAVADLAQADRNETAVIEALVQTPRLNLVRRGQAVTVYLADRPDALAAHVTDVNFDPGNTGRTGLPAALRVRDDYGLMTVRLDDPIAAPRPGLPAAVTAPITWTALFANFPALQWGKAVIEKLAEQGNPVWSTLFASAGKSEEQLTGKGDRLVSPRRGQPA